MFFILTISLALSAQTQHQHHPPRSADEYAKVLEDPGRDAWQKPHEVIQALGIKSTDTIADIGAGSGYFSRRFAHHAKLVYAVDIDRALLAIIDKQAAPNVKSILATSEDPKLPQASVDIIFICDVLHHIDHRPAYYAKLRHALKPGGRIVIVDFYKRPLPIGPPESMKLDEKSVTAELQTAGFRLTKSLTFLPHQYYLIFQAP